MESKENIMIKKNNVIPKKENILIVDDDESTRKTLAFIFNKKGYNVETVGTGHEALEMAQQKSFNLALLDIKLPDIEGIELLVPLKKIHPDMETIMMTAYSSLETVIRALNEGASAYIIKPLNLDDVLNKINSIFERQRLTAEKKNLEQELHYQAMLVENVSDAIISTDINLTIKSWNKAAEIMYGWKSDEIIGKAMSEIIPEEAPYAQNEKVREHIFEKGFWRGEIIQKKKDNTMLNIFSSATLIKDNSGKIQGVVVINRDITKSKKAEVEIVNLAKFPSENPNPILRVTKGKVIYTNKQGEKIFNTHKGSEVPAVLKEIIIETLNANKNTSTEITLNNHIFSLDVTPISEEEYANVYGKDITKRKKAEQRLKESQEKYKSLFEKTPMAILLVDFELTIEDCNTSAEVLFGYTKEELLGGDSLKFDNIHPDTKLILAKSFSKYLNTGVPEQSEIQMYKKDGKMIWVNVFPIQVKVAEKSYILVMFQDVTEKKKFKQKIRESEELYRTMINSLADPLYVVNRDLKILLINPALEIWLEDLGIEKVIIGQTIFEAFPFLPNEIRKEYKQIFDTGEIQYTEGSTLINGKEIITETRRISLFKEGHVNQVLVITRDITERRKVEDLIKYSEAKFRGVFESKLIGTLFWNPEGEITDANKAFLDMVGYTKDEVLNGIVSWKDMTPPEYLERDEKLLKELATNGYISPIEKEYYHKDGHRIPIILGASTLPGSTVRGVAFVLDITERKKAEAELKKTMKDLKNSNIELEQFAYVASHDLQEPLRMVASFTQLLQDRYKDKLDEDANDFINYAVDGATRMQNLINDLLIFSRVGSRGKPFKIVDMNVVIENVLNNFRQLIKETHSMVIYDPLPVIEADESQMIQLFQNLISNGIKFRGEKDPIIHVTAETKANKWIFTVKDNGIGIDNKFFDRIFIIFQRLHKKSEYGGTGIGLAVCKKIVQRHGGKIWVDSEFGKGSSFHVTIKKRKQARNSVSHSNFRFK